MLHLSLHQVRSRALDVSFDVARSAHVALIGPPACGASTFAKQLTAAGFQLKGSGWYATDFKSGAKKSDDAKAEGKPEAKSDAKAETKTESKTEKKAEKNTAASSTN